MIDTEKDKLKQKIEWLKQHLNTDKTPKQLDAEFEVWYKEDFKKRQDAETLTNLTQAVMIESQLTYQMARTDYDPLSYRSKGTICLNRACTLQAFVNVIRLKAAETNGRYEIVLENSDPENWYHLTSCDILGLQWEPSDTWFRHSMKIISEAGRYEHDIADGMKIWVKPYKNIDVGND